MTGEALNYELDYDWDYPWPRGPVPRNEAVRLAELKKYNILNTPREAAYNEICEIVNKEMNCPISAISLISSDKQWFKANSGLTHESIPRDVAFCAHTIMNPKTPLVVKDATQDKRFMHNPLVTRASAIRFYAGVCLCSPKGLPIGTLFVFDTEPHQTCNITRLAQLAQQVTSLLNKRVPEYKPEELKVEKKKVEATPEAHSPPKPHAVEPPQPTQSRSSLSTASTTAPKPPARRAAPPPPPPRSSVQLGRKPAPSPPKAPSTGATGQLVPHKAPVSSSTALAPGGAGGQQNNLGAMLMNLLARTTETQQQLANQQGVMFDTIGQHSKQLDSLTEKLRSLESIIDKRATS